MRSLLPAGLVATAWLLACASEPSVPEPAAPIEPVERAFAWDGTRLSYVDAGLRGDEAIVLVHGWASSVATWRRQIPALAPRARVLAVDLPGHGASGAPEGPYTMALFADAVAAAMDDAGVARAVVVGHSNGAPAALRFLRRHPERTLAIVTVDGALERVLEREQVEPLLAQMRGPAWRGVVTGFVQGMPAPDLADEDRAAILEMALATPQEAVVGGIEAALDPAGWDDEPIDVPVLAVYARQPTWDAAYEARLRARAPALDYRVWDGAGHFLHVERPAELHAALEEFLAAHDLL